MGEREKSENSEVGQCSAIARCAWSAQIVVESFGCTTMGGCARSNRRLQSKSPYLGKSDAYDRIAR